MWFVEPHPFPARGSPSDWARRDNKVTKGDRVEPLLPVWDSVHCSRVNFTLPVSFLFYHTDKYGPEEQSSRWTTGEWQQEVHNCFIIFTICSTVIRGDSVARDPKLLSMYTVEQRGVSRS